MAELGFWAIAADDPGHLALVEADGRETSAGQLLAASNQIARGLQALGLQRGDVVAALLPNRREMIELALGATQVGLYLTPINYHLTAPKGDNVHLVPAPLYHTAAMTFGGNSLHMGHTVVLMDKWGAEPTLQLADRYRCTTTHMVPTMFHRMLALPDETKARYDMSAWTHVIHAAAPCPVEVKQRMLEWWGPVIYEYYAATEGGGTLVTPEEWVKKPGTVGTPWPISEIKVLDDEFNEVGPN